MNIEPCNVNRNSLRDIKEEKEKRILSLNTVFIKIVVLDEPWAYELKAMLRPVIRFFIVKILLNSKSYKMALSWN